MFKINYLLFLCLSNLSLALDKADNLPPIILVPGDGGNRIEAKLDKPEVVHFFCDKKYDWYTLWLSFTQLAKGEIDCWVDNIRLIYDPKTRTTSSPAGVETRIPGFGETDTVEYIAESSHYAYFGKIVDAILPMGYVRNVSIKGAPYDFRKAPNELFDFFEDFSKLIESTYTLNSNRRVILLAHSMGAPMITYLLANKPQTWKDKYINSVVSLGGAWGGAFKAIKVYAAGDNLGTRLLSSLTMRTEQRTSPSLAFLLPSKESWKETDILVTTPSKNYTMLDYKELFTDLDYTDAYEMYLDTKDLISGVKSLGVRMFCLYGVGVQTDAQLVYSKQSYFPDYPTIVYRDGDGTVNKQSLELPIKWANNQAQPVTMKPLKGVNHLGILTDAQTMASIKDIISKVIEPVGDIDGNESLPCM